MEVLNHKAFVVTDEILANKGRRFLNLMIDRIAFYLIFILIGAFLGLFFSLIGYEEGLLWIGQLENISQAWDILLTLSIMFLYYFAMESLVGRTIGKALTKTVVVLKNGEKPTTRDIAIRTISRFIPFDPLSFLGNPTRGWHDSLSETYVVKEDLLKESIRLHKRFIALGEEIEEETI